MPHNLVRRVVVLAGLPVLIGVFVLTLTQCRMVGDKLTGLETSRAPNSCIKTCNDSSKVDFENEQKAHEQNVMACQALPQPQRGECLEAEEQRHEAEKARLTQVKMDCQNGCHQQGGGSGR
jgi:hypothetical protein